MLREPYTSVGLSGYLSAFYNLNTRGLQGDYLGRFKGWDFVLQACAECQAITQRFAPDEALAAELYGHWIDEDPERQHKRVPPLDEYMHQIQEALILTTFLLRHSGKAVPSSLKVLDFGTGWGRFALAMKAVGCEVHAFEFSFERREAARRNGLTIVNYEDIPSSNFDFINTEQVFEHVAEPLATGRHLAAGLVSGGVLKISVPFARWLERRPDGLRIDWSKLSGSHSPIAVAPLEHLTYFKRPSLNVMASILGLDEVKLNPLDELNCSFNWRSARNIGKNITRPFIRRLIRNYQLFERI